MTLPPCVQDATLTRMARHKWGVGKGQRHVRICEKCGSRSWFAFDGPRGGGVEHFEAGPGSGRSARWRQAPDSPTTAVKRGY